MIRTVKGRIYKALKIGSVWSLYLLPEIILIAAFCLDIRGCKCDVLVEDQVSIAYIR